MKQKSPEDSDRLRLSTVGHKVPKLCDPIETGKGQEVLTGKTS